MKPFNMTKLFHFLNILFIIGMLFLILVMVQPLPSEIATHFAFDGTPDKFGDKNSLIMLVMLAMIVTGMMVGLIALIPWVKKKRWVSFPDKEKFLALPLEKQDLYWDLVKEFMAAFAAAMNLLWLTTLYGAVLVASKKLTKLPEWAIMPALFILLVLNLFYIRRMIKLPEQLIKAAADEGD